MRIKQDRLKVYFLKKRKIIKDSEGGTSEEYGAAIPFKGVCWPASGKIQAAQYGQRLAYIRNIKIEGKYEVRADEKGRIHYILKNGMDLEELDGICLYTGEMQNPDYKIIAAKPYRFLTLEVEKI